MCEVTGSVFQSGPLQVASIKRKITTIDYCAITVVKKPVFNPIQFRSVLGVSRVEYWSWPVSTGASGKKKMTTAVFPGKFDSGDIVHGFASLTHAGRPMGGKPRIK